MPRFKNENHTLSKICPTCGNEFQTFMSLDKIYCSLKCYHQGGNKHCKPTNKVVKTDWGISFIGPTGWEKSFNTNQITLLQEGVSAGDGITIDYISGNKITDTDAKFGNVTYYYSDSSQAWIVESPDEQNGGTLPPTTATPALHTTSGLPVFLGTHRWATYIIPLSHTTFLKLNIGGGGNTQPLTELVKTIQKI